MAYVHRLETSIHTEPGDAIAVTHLNNPRNKILNPNGNRII